MKIAGFKIAEVIYSIEDTVVARATTEAGDRVILKYQNTQYPSQELNARWQHEHRILASIDSPWVVKSLGIQTTGHSLILIMEDHAQTNLEQLIQQNQLDFTSRLKLALQLCSAISDIHKHQLIHCDISPKNILVDIETLKLKLCDFGLATRLSREQASIKHSQLWGTLDYMSPEQTGRTNLDVDYRSDFYSLGVSLYELFSGRKPFQYDDPTSLLHAHIARVPKPLMDICPQVPEPVSRIVARLLAKSPDDRYQSSYGLIADFNHCLEEWQANQKIEPFVLGQSDIPERFCVANKLYGREQETESILAAFERANAGRAELLLVSGYSGIGKTALVNELHKPIVANRGLFIKGKCEQFGRNRPYAALIQAFQPLMRQLLNEGEEKLRYWRFMLRCALGDNARVITDIIPELAQIIGEPPPLQVLPAADAENRFHIAFTQFVNALSCSGRPLVWFLDDLQWADIPTLKLLEQQILNKDERALLIIAAYRDNEVDHTHPLSHSLKVIEQAQGYVCNLKLRNLSLKQVTQLVADTLSCDPDEAEPLATLCLDKTQGNPFFLNQFLTALYDEGELGYNRELGLWQWDVAHIQKRGMTDNVIEFMLVKLHKLEEDTQKLLSLAAHLGNRFSLKLLALVNQPEKACDINTIVVETANTLWPALRTGLIVPLSEEYKFNDTPEKLAQARYRFLHDRVQHAAYSLTPDQDRPALQISAARSLLANTDPEDIDGQIFTILELFNNAIHLIESEQEKGQVRALNIRGGIKAMDASAYPAAVAFLTCARKLLPGNSWAANPEQTLTLYKRLAEAEYLSGNFDAAEAIYETAIPEAPDNVSRVTLLLVQADQYHIQGRFADSTPVLLSALSLLGHTFPALQEISDQQLGEEYGATEKLLAETGKSQLLNAPEMTDAEHLLRMRIYNALSFATYQTGELKGFLINACNMVRCTLTHGQCDLSCIGYVAYVTVMSAMGQPYPECYNMGKLAMDLAEQRENKYFRLTIYQYFSAFYQHWCEPIENSFPYLEKGVEWGLEGINLLSAGYCALLGAVNKFAKGLPLSELEKAAHSGLSFLQKSLQPNTENYVRYGILQPVLALRGKTLSPLSFDSDTVSTTEFFNGDYSTPSIHLALHTWAMLRHAYLMDNVAAQRQFAEQLPVVGMCLPDGPAVVESTFFVALIRLKALSRELAEQTQPHTQPHTQQQATDEQDPRLLEAREIAARFKTWMSGCKENFEHKYLLIAAEIARVTGDDKGAMSLYAQAIESAKKAEYPMYEALANELYANYWRDQQQIQVAANLIREAHYHYQQWGAKVKCKQLGQTWPHLSFKLEDRRPVRSSFTSTFKKVSEQTEMLDLHSLLKANQLLSEELRLDSLLQKMMEVLLENAGAEQGAIILTDDDKLVVEMMGKLNPQSHEVECNRTSVELKDLCDNDHPQLPDSLINHVRETLETTIINRPFEDSRFSYNTYLQQRQPKSTLCLPILSQGKPVAIVYLENNLLENAFTSQHKMTLELLSSQAAVSLINARLYDNMEEKVLQRTEQLRLMSMKDGLTNIANRRSFDERLDAEWRRSSRNGRELSLLMIDIDHFKEFNDFYGHLEGDACIKAVAQALAESAPRVTDFVARYGGEEFAVLMAESSEESALAVANTCREAVAALAIPHSKSITSTHVTISVGACSMSVEPGMDASELIGKADQALYQAKSKGRNRVCVYNH